MAGRGGYAQLSNGLWLNDKANDLLDVAPRAFGVWVMSLSYASDNMTDGVLNARALRRLGCDDRTRDTLIEWGMWEQLDDGTVRIHDYLAHNMSRAAIENAQAKTAERIRRHRAKNTQSDVTRNVTHDVTRNVTHDVTQENDVTKRVTVNQNTKHKTQNTTSPYPLHDDDQQAEAERQFDIFLRTYPKGGNRNESHKAWEQALASGTPSSQIVAAVKKYAMRVHDEKPPQRYIPTPANWLNGQRWKDDTPPASKPDLPSERWTQTHLIEPLTQLGVPSSLTGTTYRKRLYQLIRDGNTWADAAATILHDTEGHTHDTDS